MKQVKKLPLTKECHHWRRLGEVPWDLQKYWQQRHTIFSNYNEGIYMTHDAWYGVTPEPVAIQIANDLDAVFPLSRTTIVDAFAGVGANAISFALQPHPEDAARRRWDRVVAVERDPSALACALHNAALHGVADSIIWVLGDSFEYLGAALAGHSRQPTSGSRGPRSDSSSRSSSNSLKLGSDGTKEGRKRKRHHHLHAAGGGSDADGDADGDADADGALLTEDLRLDPDATVVFASPPWGGPGYSTDAVFNLDTMEPYNLARLHGAYAAVDHALYLPRTSDLRQIARLAPPRGEGGGDDGNSGSNKRRGDGNEGGRTGGGDSGYKKIEVVQYCVEGASKALVAYIPAAEPHIRNSDVNTEGT
ncbi:hypothetical protein DL769_005805 [Monosporascus sp. CRB-8-3]|nr:hypothetical protein DL769_005805 [Monosporascus sp. CRB-8-3]